MRPFCSLLSSLLCIVTLATRFVVLAGLASDTSRAPSSELAPRAPDPGISSPLRSAPALQRRGRSKAGGQGSRDGGPGQRASTSGGNPSVQGAPRDESPNSQTNRRIASAILRSRSRGRGNPVRGGLPNLEDATPEFRYLRRAAQGVPLENRAWYALRDELPHAPSGHAAERLVIGRLQVDASERPPRRDWQAWAYTPVWIPAHVPHHRAGWNLHVQDYRVVLGMRIETRSVFLGRCRPPMDTWWTEQTLRPGDTEEQFLDWVVETWLALE